MKEMVNIRYKTVISHGDEKIDDLYEGMATHDFSLTKETWSFTHQKFGQMEIIIFQDQLLLKHGQSEIKLDLQKQTHIPYQTPYGIIELNGVLKKLERKQGQLRVVYYLYDGLEIISQCYLVLDVINTNLS